MLTRSEKIAVDGLDVDIIRSIRTTSTIIVRDGRITIRAPLSLPTSELVRLVREKRPWIDRHLGDKPKNVTVHWIDGEEVYYLGRKYRLALRQGKPARVEITGEVMNIWGTSLASQQKAYRQFMEETLDDMVDRFHSQLRYQVGDYSLEYRYYKARWGCCFKNRRQVMLNICCGCLPEEAIRYVYCHELAHLKEANHQKAFYDELSRILPDYRKGMRLTKEYMIE